MQSWQSVWWTFQCTALRCSPPKTLCTPLSHLHLKKNTKSKVSALILVRSEANHKIILCDCFECSLRTLSSGVQAVFPNLLPSLLYKLFSRFLISIKETTANSEVPARCQISPKRERSQMRKPIRCTSPFVQR